MDVDDGRMDKWRAFKDNTRQPSPAQTPTDSPAAIMPTPPSQSELILASKRLAQSHVPDAAQWGHFPTHSLAN